jgi:hypothetical protein
LYSSKVQLRQQDDVPQAVGIWLRSPAEVAGNGLLKPEAEQFWGILTRKNAHFPTPLTLAPLSEGGSVDLAAPPVSR